ncbi:hypothetical protein CEXT_170401 [Caerostris extrusa]|uniref:Uncharacterized protein n=1 Tax=Caerostris extrusa TaxID=172846 RepID=A0AAV4M8L5_CAEEX|nr:hypothetical protein CEXT_170401 [Caerostris extrusa]
MCSKDMTPYGNKLTGISLLKMRDNDCYGSLWCFIKLLGIDIFEHRHDGKKKTTNAVLKTFTNKLTKMFFPFMLHAMIIYGIISWVILCVKGVTTIEVLISFTVSNLFSLASGTMLEENGT